MQKKLEQALGYTYRDRQLLETALSHTSYANEIFKDNLHSYERLEFLGDSILGFVTADYLFRTFPNKHEGELTRIRAELVCEKNLAAIAERLNLGDYLLLGNGEEHGGGRHRSGTLCDVMESLIAAAYLDGGFEAAKGIVQRLILPELAQKPKSQDYKTELQELVQRRSNQTLHYEMIGATGPDHAKLFTCAVLLNGQTAGTGTGKSKKEAEQTAARAALQALQDLR